MSEASGPTSEKVNLLDFDAKSLRQFCVDLGEKPFRGSQVFKWIHKRYLNDFEDMTDLSINLREKLKISAEIKAPEIVHESCSVDGTRKWLLRLFDNNHIETVFIPERDRGTLCVSSQVGCALNCTFCATATQGFNRNLKVAEIIGQVFQAAKCLEKVPQTPEGFKPQITNVVMMGMGEPLLNFDAVVKAMSIMRDDNAYALPKRRVTLSTSGIVPNIDRLSAQSDVSLAISLHAPNDALRNVLVPINKKYPIVELMAACLRYAKGTNNAVRHITIEYVMLKGVNDSPMHAKQLVKVLSDLPCKVNLIPFNPFPGVQYQRSEDDTISIFQAILMKAGFITTIRRTRGGDIDAACGQLKGRVIDRTQRSQRWIAHHVQEENACLKTAIG